MVASSVHARVMLQGDLQIFYKEFLPRSPLETIKAILRGSRAARARSNSDLLLAAGFNAPENLVGGKLPGGREYLFTRAVPGEGITDWLRTTLAGRSAAELHQRRQLLRQLGAFIGQLHAAGFTHGDLRPSNALAELTGQQFRFSLIDNERNHRQLPAPRKLVLKNLMQLNMLLPSDLTRSDRWRFFCAWQAQMKDLTSQQARQLAVEAYQWAMTRLRAKGKV